MMGRHQEAIETAKEALVIFESLEDFYAIRTRKQLIEWQKKIGEERLVTAPAKTI